MRHRFLARAAVASVLALAALNWSASRAHCQDEWGAPASSFPFPVPLGLQAPPVPADNPITPAKVALGKLLYFDGRLSKNGLVSCETCHDPRRGWTDESPVSAGIHGLHGTRNAPPVFNAAYNTAQFWDGRASDLEHQMEGPVQNPVEMGFSLSGAAERIAAVKGYRPYFKAAFGDGAVSMDRIEKAIASFERTILEGDSPYDRYRAGDKKALSPRALRGMAIFFGKGNCDACHSGFNFSDSDYHNLGVGMERKHPDLGRYDATKNPKDRGAFKTPTLRGLLYTAPYMHDGSDKTLAQVVEFYNKGGRPNAHLDPQIRPLGLSAREQKDLVAFLKALSGPPLIVKPPKHLPR